MEAFLKRMGARFPALHDCSSGGWSGFFNPWTFQDFGFPAVYAVGMSNGFVSFSVKPALDVFESALAFDSYAQQVLRFRVLGL